MADVRTLKIQVDDSSAIASLKQLSAQGKTLQNQFDGKTFSSFGSAANDNFIKVGNSAKKAKADVSDFTKSSQSSLGGLTKTLGGLAAGFSLGAIATSVGKTIAEFETMRTVLNTVTGSVENGGKAFAMLQDVAKKTPNELKDMIETFNILKARGINPTEQALLSFSNTAAAMGKPVTQFAEAVADAMTGEFERLKEFGINVSKQGNELAVTFQGTTTKIGNNSKEIVDYLNGIGNTKFAGAAEAQMNTLAGTISNIKDNFATLAYEIGEGGVKQALSEVAKSFGDFLSTNQNIARDIGSALGGAITIAAKAAGFLLSNLELIAPVLIGIAASKAFTALGTGITLARTAMASFNLVVAANPIGLIATAIALAVVGLTKLTQNFLQAKGITASFGDVLGAIGKTIVGVVQPAIASIGKFLGGLGSIFVDLGGIIKSWMNLNIATYKTIYDVGSLAITNLWTVIKGFFTGAVAASAQFASNVWGNIKAAFTGGDTVNVFKGVGDAWTKQFGDVGKQMGDAINNNFKTDYVAKGFGALKNAASGFADAVAKNLTPATKEQAKATKELGDQQLVSGQAAKVESEATKKLNEDRKNYVAQLKASIIALQDEQAAFGKTASQAKEITLQREAERLGIEKTTQALRDKINTLNAELDLMKFNASFKKMLDNYEQEVKMVKMSADEREVYKAVLDAENLARENNQKLSAGQIAQITDEVKALQAAKKAQENFQKQLDFSKQTLEANRTPLQQYTASANELKAALDSGAWEKAGGTLADYNKQLALLKSGYKDAAYEAQQLDLKQQNTFSSGAKMALNEYIRNSSDVATQTATVFQNAFSAMDAGIKEFVTTGKFNFGDFAKSVIADLAAMAIKVAASKFLAKLFGIDSSGLSVGASNAIGTSTTASSSAGSSTTSGGVLSTIGKAIGGLFKAKGGLVKKGLGYIVGEKGPEWFNPGSTGNIINTKALKSQLTSMVTSKLGIGALTQATSQPNIRYPVGYNSAIASGDFSGVKSNPLSSVSSLLSQVTSSNTAQTASSMTKSVAGLLNNTATNTGATPANVSKTTPSVTISGTTFTFRPQQIDESTKAYVDAGFKQFAGQMAAIIQTSQQIGGVNYK